MKKVTVSSSAYSRIINLKPFIIIMFNFVNKTGKLKRIH